MKYFKNITGIVLVLICFLSLTGSGLASSASRQSPEAAEEVLNESDAEQTPVDIPPIVTPSSDIPTIPTKDVPSADIPPANKTPQKKSSKITISFVGDCLIATADGTTNRVGSLNWTADHQLNSYFFDKVSALFAADDFTVADCENVFTDSAFTPIGKDGTAFWFRSATKNASIFQAGKVDIVSVANNHTGDYGKAGFTDTVKSLESVGMKVGYGDMPVIVEKYGIRIGIICSGLWSYGQSSSIINQLKKIESKTDIQIVYFHGGQEKIHQPESWKTAAVHQIVDAGADLVIGGHPHVLQPMEIYHGVPIVYSIGNFVYGGNQQPENRTIIFQASLEINSGKASISYSIIPCYVFTGKTNNWQPDKIVNETEKNKVLDFMNGKRELPY